LEIEQEEFKPQQFAFKDFSYEEFKPESISIEVLRRGVIGVQQIGYV
jgi:hypothetical protein